MEGAGRSRRSGEGSEGEGGGEEEVERLISGLRLTDGEIAGVRLGKKKDKKGEAEQKLCLVGKLLTKKNFNVEALVKTLTSVWRPSRGLDHKSLEGNLILFQFYDGDDMSRVMKDGPWSFDGYALILKEFEGDKRPTDIEFDKLSMWVRIYNLPLNCMTKEEGQLLGATVGEVEEVEVDRGGKAWGRFLRVRVKVDVTAPLPRGVMLYLEEGAEKGMWCRATYEKLPNYCYHCDKLDHLDKDCQVPSVPGQKLQYGAWLRASPVRKKGWGAGKTEEPNNTEGRSGRAKGLTQSRLLDRLDKGTESKEWGINMSRRRNNNSQEVEVEEGSTSVGKEEETNIMRIEKVATSGGARTERNSGLITREDQTGADRSLVLRSNESDNSGMEVTSPQKKKGKEKGKQQTEKGKEKMVRRRFKAKPRGSEEQEGNEENDLVKPFDQEREGLGKRKQRGSGAEGSDNSEQGMKLKEKRGRWMQTKEPADDVDMLLVDLVGAEAQPHQEQCI